MIKINHSTIILLFLCIEIVFSQGPGPKEFPKHPGDIKFFDLEKMGKKPKDVNLRFSSTDVPNINVEIIKIKDQESSNDILTNKSKVNIKWNVVLNPNINNFQRRSVKNNYLAQNNIQQEQDNNLPQNNNSQNISNPTFTLKLISNVTQDSTTNLFYSYTEQLIQANVNGFEYEYKIPKLDEDCVYNIEVVSETPNNEITNIGISKTYFYKYIEKDDSKEESEGGSGKSGINPIVILVIGIVGLAIVGLAYVISKSLGKNDKHEDDEDVNLPQSTSNDSDNIDIKKDIDRVSVITDDTGEVSWTNLEIAQTSQQTKNEANDNVIRTLDRKFKRDNKDRSSNLYDINEKQLYKVVRMFNPSEEDEIKLNIGDEVEITVIFEDGWCEGNNLSTKQSGVFPRTCLVEREQYASMIEKTKKNSLVPSRRRSKHSSFTNVNSPQNYQLIESSDFNIFQDIKE